jgi:hypothetical protein
VEDLRARCQIRTVLHKVFYAESQARRDIYLDEFRHGVHTAGGLAEDGCVYGEQACDREAGGVPVSGKSRNADVHYPRKSIRFVSLNHQSAKASLDSKPEIFVLDDVSDHLIALGQGAANLEALLVASSCLSGLKPIFPSTTSCEVEKFWFRLTNTGSQVCTEQECSINGSGIWAIRRTRLQTT